MDVQAWQDRLTGLLEEHGVPGVSVAALAGDEVTAVAAGVLDTATGVAVGAGPTDYDVELTPLPGGRFAGRWPFQTEWTPVRFLRVARGDVLHVSGRATPRVSPAPR